MHRNSRLQSISELYETAIGRFEEARALILSAPAEPVPETVTRVEGMTSMGVECIRVALGIAQEIQPLSPAQQEDLSGIIQHQGQQAREAATALQAAMYDDPRFGVIEVMEAANADPRFPMSKLGKGNLSALSINGRRPSFGTPVPPQP